MKNILLVFLLLSGCQDVYPCNGGIVLVQPSEAIAMWGLSDVHRGLHVWDEVGCVYRTKDELSEFELSRTSGPVLHINDWNHHPPSESGEYEYWPGEILLDVGIFNDTDYATQTVAHEVGHAMGLDHVPISWGPAIMNAQVNRITKITPLDYNEWCFHWCGKRVDVGGRP